MKFPPPRPHRSPEDKLPDGRPTTYVVLPTWFYVDEASWKPQSMKVSAGPVWARLTATPSLLTFDPGNGDAPVSCAGPGRAWVDGQDGQMDLAPGGCSYTYRRSSFGYPGGMVTAKYSVIWSVSWTGSDGSGGRLPDVTTSTQSTFAVAEAQAVVR